MPYIQYDTAAGQIHATNSHRVDDDALDAQGRAQIEVPEELDPAAFRVNLETMEIEPLEP